VLLHAALEQANDVAVVRILGEAETAAIMHELLEFLRQVLAQVVDGRLLLLLLDVGVLLGLRSAGQALPGQRALQEVENDMTNGLEVISARLLVAKMGVHGGVSGGTREVLTISEGNVLAVGRLVALGESKIDDIDRVLGLVIAANQEVVGLNVTMNDALLVDDLDSLDHLGGNMKHGFQVKLAAALLEQVLERLAEQIHNHDVEHFSILSFLVADEM
jgi:hypothetical protein